MLPAPLTYLLQGTAKSVFGRTPLNHPIALERTTPMVGETQKVKGPGALAPAQSLARRPKHDQASLLRMEEKPKFTEPFL
jgi:hypothetical protein